MKNQLFLSMKMTKIFAGGGILFSAFLFSCANNDTEGPGVVVNSPTQNATVFTGSNLIIDADFTDNEALNQYKIDIHGEHDGHSHGKLNSIYPAFDTIIVGNFSGNTIGDIEVIVPIPDNIWPGPYHVMVYGLDQKGNETYQLIEVTVVDATDTVAPDVTVNLPVPNANIGSNITIDALISDKLSNLVTDGAIDQIHVMLHNTGTDEEFELGEYDSDGNFGGHYDEVTGQFQVTVNVPGTAAAGTYELEIIAVDMYFNTTVAAIDLIKP